MSERKYTPEFKKESVLLVTEQGYSAKQAAKSVDVPYNTFIGWVKKYKQYKESAFPGKGRLRPSLRDLGSNCGSGNERSGETCRIVP